jgi:hypothetical protein
MLALPQANKKSMLPITELQSLEGKCLLMLYFLGSSSTSKKIGDILGGRIKFKIEGLSNVLLLII